MLNLRPFLAAAIVAAAPGVEANGIYRCAGAQGAVTYQQFPCEQGGGPTALPTTFPEIDIEARNRLFAREAALDRRLEAQRDRLSAEAIARLSRPDPTPPPAEPSMAWPVWAAYPAARWPQRPHSRSAVRDWAYGRPR